MSTLTFPDTHNMVAFLEKLAESDGFHKVIDLLNANQIHYALTVNPTIYTSCIEHFWATAKKKQSRRKQKKNTEVPHPSDSTADVPNEEHVPTHSNDPLISGKDRMRLTELMDMCTKLSEKVLDLEHTKTAQAQEITNLKLRVKKLEKKAGFRTHNFKRLYKGRSRIEAIDRDAEVTLVETQRRNDENDDNRFSTYEIDLAQEITLAQALAAMKSAKPKEKDVFQESSENVKSKDKGKAIMIEPKMPLKKKDQIELNEELVREIEAEEKKFFTAQRAEAIRNKPLTKNQRRNQKIQYLKNIAGYSHAQLKDKSFDEVQKLFEKHMKWINSFVPMEEDLSSEKVEDDKEEEELKKCFELAKEEEIAINAIPLATKVPVIGFQIHTRGKPGYYEIFRADGSSKLYHVFSQLLSDFDREDLVNLWKLVKAKHGDKRPEEDFERCRVI
ncbi:hypothetical protein Tco_0782213 [Tanacetum coccineum]